MSKTSIWWAGKPPTGGYVQMSFPVSRDMDGLWPLDFSFAATYRRLRVFVVSTSRAGSQVRTCLVVPCTLASYAFLVAVHIRSRSVVPRHCK